MKLTSSDFEHMEKIPTKFTGDEQNINPNLEISNIPENTKSLVLIFYDPDAPTGIWVHWLVWNISPKTSLISENSIPGIQGKNSWGRNDYGGPMPPSGTHRYFFKLYALDKVLDLKKDSNKQELEKDIQNNILDKVKLIGLYR